MPHTLHQLNLFTHQPEPARTHITDDDGRLCNNHVHPQDIDVPIDVVNQTTVLTCPDFCWSCWQEWQRYTALQLFLDDLDHVEMESNYA